MRAAALTAAVVAAFVGVMYLRFASDSVPGPPAGSAVGGPQCVVARTASEDRSDDHPAEPTCGPDYAYEPFAPPAVEPLATPEPTTPALLSGMKVLPLVPGPMLDLPSDIALVLETGCWQCDGGTTSLVRVSTRRDGLVKRDTLLDPAALGLSARQITDASGTVNEFAPHITGYVISGSAQEVIATICVRGTCAPDGLDSWSPDSRTAVMRSRDGGVTWTEVDRLDVGASVFAISPDGRVLLRTYDSRESTSARSYPGLEKLEFPPGFEYWPGSVKVLADGHLLLRDSQGVPARSDGHRLLSIPVDSPVTVSDLVIDPNLLDGLALISGSGGDTRYLVPFDSTGTLGRGAFALGGESVVWSGNPDRFGVQLVNEGLVLANALLPSNEPPPPGQGPIFDYRPVAIDLKQGVVYRLRQFSSAEYRTGRNHVVAVQRGPFARVVNTDGPCLNIRAEPLPSAGILDCAAEGVLLRDLGETMDVAGGTWLHVSTPAGSVGWANAAYLER